MSHRQSLFPSEAPTTYWQNLRACGQALDNTSQSLSTTSTTLHEGTYDFPRLITILKSHRAYEVVTETELTLAARDLLGEVSPQIDQLIERASFSIDKLQKRESILREKMAIRSKPPTTRNPTNAGTSKSNLAALEKRLKALQSKKEVMSRATERLDAEAENLRKELVELGN